ncbi:PQQ-binding-like beta-propeller repeat protein [Streptomyces sp. BPTC-684]|uniref:outer membrane protein assembly factor BamB family protein n=1 Tax=Streptomyces sp. BPTC-684 TaxID=3043734 RepID=UPI0024B04EC0|nr:PQQ-binding-like beta-propeller repeat protein [Streptomyces sp. BPTC-684]WHM38333.1 PQQ-binding-like beta-propeller repeat protein [Streptomyces sp. BPTC-684]
MSQPPQPPQQPPGEPTPPPAGGFGAPQEPPAGGFGAPTPPPAGGFGAPTPPPPAMPPTPPAQPPAAPAYGYPQTPPPGQPSAYGYPQTPPPGQPGYGYPGQPQPGYGHPDQLVTQPMAPQGAPGGPGGGKKLNAQMTIIVSAVVAVALIVGGGIWYAKGKDGDKKDESKSGSTQGADGGKDSGGGSTGGGGKEQTPANVASKVLFQVPQPKVADLVHVDGSWLTDKVYAKSGVNEIVGYDPAKGTQLWKLPLPGAVCAATTHVTPEGRTAIIYEGPKASGEKYARCTEVAVLDLATGKLAWTNSVKDGDRKAAYEEVTIGAGTVATGGTSGGSAWDLATGKLLWQPKITTDQCKDAGYGGGGALVAVRKCGDYDNPTVTIQPLNPKTGAPLSSYKMPAGVDYAHIVSTKPLVVAADVGDTAGDGSGISDFFSIDDKTGKLLARIPAPGDKYAADCDSTEVEKCTSVAAGGGKLYVPTEQHAGSTADGGRTNEIMAFDLATGQAVPGKADAGDGSSLAPLRMDGNNVIAFKKPPYDKGSQIVSIDGGSFKQTVLLQNPADTSVRDALSQFGPEYGEIRYAGGKLFMSATLISKPSTLTDEKKYLLIGLGTG